MSSNSRLKFTVIVGTNEASKRQVDNVIKKLNHFYGGITYSTKLGTWNPAAELSQKWYQVESFESEIAHYFEILTDDMSVDNNMRKLKRIIAPVMKNVANWIHVECVEVMGLHFSIDEYLASDESFELLTTEDRIPV